MARVSRLECKSITAGRNDRALTRHRVLRWARASSVATAASLLAACGGGEGGKQHSSTGGLAATGGSATGGGPTGGVSLGGSGGTLATGGAFTGGAGLGGSPTGGVATGGVATGGATTGGATTGGATTGGVATGGATTGGVGTGGVATGGVATGGVGGGPSLCGVEVSDTFDGALGEGQLVQLAALEARGGSTVQAVMTGTGDADLYVRVGVEPSTNDYDCRPYEDDASETCSVAVPAEGAIVYIAVRGYGASTYNLDVTSVPPCCAGAAECDDGNPCTVNACESDVCVERPATGACNDGDACTDGDACQAGVCTGTPRACGGGQVCIEGECTTRPTLTLYTTCVEDDLDPTDRSIMVTEMAALGYTEVGSNTNVSSTALNDLLGRSDLTTLYHTGHGFEGGVATANGDALVYGDVTTINVEHAIFATCLTLTDTRWPNKMGARSKDVLGYTDLSYDGTDNTVVVDFAAALGAGDSYIRAWYAANVAQSSLSDRWCGYTRETSGIVEYSARTNVIPAAAALRAPDLEQIDASIWVASTLLADGRTFAEELAPLQANDYVVVGDEAHAVEFFGAPGEFLRKAPLTSDEALDDAAAWLAGGLPTDAVLDDVRGITSSDAAGGAEQTVGYRVRYVRVVEDLPVLTNGRAHHLEIVADADGVAASSLLWPTLAQTPAKAPAPLLDVATAFAVAIDELRDRVKEPVSIVDVMPCGGSLEQGKLVPAFAFIDADGGHVVVDARTGHLVY